MLEICVGTFLRSSKKYNGSLCSGKYGNLKLTRKKKECIDKRIKFIDAIYIYLVFLHKLKSFAYFISYELKYLTISRKNIYFVAREKIKIRRIFE